LIFNGYNNIKYKNINTLGLFCIILYLIYSIKLKKKLLFSYCAVYTRCIRYNVLLLRHIIRLWPVSVYLSLLSLLWSPHIDGTPSGFSFTLMEYYTIFATATVSGRIEYALMLVYNMVDTNAGSWTHCLRNIMLNTRAVIMTTFIATELVTRQSSCNLWFNIIIAPWFLCAYFDVNHT